MTTLGAMLYGGFFALAALWLFLTADRSEDVAADDHGQAQDLSNSTSTSAGPAGSSPCLVTHSSQK
jgi:hypothetical protein